MLFSLDTDFIAEATLADKLSALAKAGFTHVNIRANLCENWLMSDWSLVEETKKMLHEYKLAIDWIHAPYEGINLHDNQPGSRPISLGALKYCIEIGAYLKANSLVIHPLTNTFPDRVGVRQLEVFEQQLASSFQTLVTYAEQQGLAVAAENLNDKYGTSVQLFLLEHVPQLGMCFDTGHAQLTNAWNIFLPHYAKRIIALHLQDTGGEYDDHRIPGDGIVDFPGFIRTMMDSGYSGVWGCESVYSILRDENKSAEELAAKTYNRLMRFTQSAIEKRQSSDQGYV